MSGDDMSDPVPQPDPVHAEIDHFPRLVAQRGWGNRGWPLPTRPESQPTRHRPGLDPRIRASSATMLRPMSVSIATRIRLALLSGNRCAMPSCHRPLSELRGDDVVLVGEAAHIAGQHGGGARGRPSARFDPTLTREQRNSLTNLLYVCRNCHAEIDAHPHGEREYPVQRLLAIKADHESAVATAMEEAMASVSFRELEAATQWVTEVPPPPPGLDFSRIPIEDKIRKHGLSVSSQNLISSRLTATRQVRSFVQALSQDDSAFPDRLISGFLEHYYKLRKDGTSSGEDLFNSMCMFARRGFLDFKTQYAAETVLVYLFETCEVFER